MRIYRWGALIALLIVAVMLAGCALFDPAPIADFSWTPSEPLSRIEVQFTDTSTDTSLIGAGGITTWSWDFGDSQSSTAQNPKHTYQSAGTYSVRLTVTDTSGTSTTRQKTVTILPSLNGRWEGTLYDPTPWPFVLNINHSATGGISGTSSFPGTAWSSTISSATFSQATLQVRLSFGVGVAATIVLVGTYNPATETVTGHWEDFFFPGVNLGPFDMHLQP